MAKCLILSSLLLPLSSTYASQWMDVATISSTLGNTAGRLCVGGGRTDVGCPATSPFLDSAAGLLTVPGDLRVVGNLYVSGSQSFDGVTFVGGGISATGPISATSLNINGVPVSGGTPDHIISGTTNVYTNTAGSISFTTAGSTGAYIYNGQLVAGGVSTTGVVSSVGIYNSGTMVMRNGNIGLNSNYGLLWGNSSTGSMVNGSAASNYLAFTTSGTEALRIVSNGYVGIGTTNPSATLHVYDTTTAQIRFSNSGNANGGYIGVDGNAFGRFGAPSGVGFGYGNTPGLFTEVLRVTSGNLVGIGTANPSATLNIMSAADTTSSGLIIGSTTGSSANRMQVFPSGNASVVFKMLNNGNITYRDSTNTAFALFDAISRKIGFGDAFSATPSTTLHVSGTIRIADGGEACDTNRVGAIKYASNAFYICQNTSNGWEALATTGANSLADRITSNSQAGVIANSTGYISLTTGGVTGTVYFAPNGRLVTTEVSTTGIISTTGLFSRGDITLNNGNIRMPSGFIVGWGSNYITGAGAGAGNYIALTASGTEALRIVSTGLVGIGTTDPSQTLDVNGLAVIGKSSASGRLYFRRGSDGTYSSDYLGLADTAGQDFRFHQQSGSGYFTWYTNSGTVDQRMVLANNGNLGIGTSGTTPSATLHVSGTGIITSWTTIGSTTVPQYPLDIQYDVSGGNSHGIRLGGSSTNYLVMGYNGINTTGGAFNINATNSQNIYLGAAGGKVGVGQNFYSTTNPSTTLHVSGSIRISAETSSTLNTCDADRLGAIKYTAGAFYICENTSNGWEALATTGANSLADRITSNSQAGVIANDTGYISLTTGGVTGTVYFAPNGRLVTSEISTTGAISTTQGYFSNNIGVGTAPNSSIGVYATGIIRSNNKFLAPNGTASAPTYSFSYSPDTGLYSPVTSTIALAASGTEALRIVSTGYVGIGTTTPSSTLHIMGVSNSTGGFTLGSSENNLSRLQIYPSGASSAAIYLPQAAGTLTFTRNGTGGIMRLDNPGVFIGGSVTPSTTLDVSGTLKIANGNESCDALRLGAIRYVSGSTFQICQNVSNGWEPLATSTSSTTPAISTGLSGSIVYRDQNGYLIANNTFSISSTTGSIGIGAGPTAGLGNNGLYAVGNIYSNNGIGAGVSFYLQGGYSKITGNGSQGGDNYLAFTTSNTEQMRIVSTGYVGIGTSSPTYPLQVSGTGIVLDNSAGTQLRILPGAGASFQLGQTNSAFYYRASNSNYLMSLNSSGNMALGLSGGSSFVPSTTLHVSGTLRIADAGEACDTNRLGAIKYTANEFYVCRNAGTGWESLTSIATGAAALADRITSSSQAGVTANSTGYISLTTGGVTGTVYFAPNGRLVTTQVSTTGSISGTQGYFGSLGINQAPNNTYLLGVAGSASIDNNLVMGNGSTIGFNDSLTKLLGYGGADGYLAINTGGAERLRIVSTGYVGIGTSTPAYPLDVAGNARALDYMEISATTANAFANLQMNYTGDANGYGELSFGPGDYYWGMGVASANYAANPTLRNSFYIYHDKNGAGVQTPFFPLLADDTGKVGIANVTNPSTSLHVGGSIRIGAETSTTLNTCDTSRLGAMKYTANEFYVCRNAGTGWESFTSIATGAAALADRITSSSQAGVTANATGYISLTTGGVTGTVYFAPNGRLVTTEISTTGQISASTLYVNGNTSMNGDNYFGTGKGLRWGLSATGNSILGDPNSKYLAFTTSNTEALRIVSSGYVGINTTAPTAALEVSGTLKMSTNGATTGLNLFNNSMWTTGADMFLNNNSGGNVQVLSNNATGKMGLGLLSGATPSATLHVSGTAQFSQYIGVGGAASAGSVIRVVSTSNPIISFDNGTYTGYTGLLSGGAYYAGTQQNTPLSLFTSNTTRLYINGTGSVGIGTLTPSTSLHVSGTLRIADGGEACDANRLGAIRYASSEFYVCRNGSNWESFTSIANGAASLADRITSNSQAGVTANATGYISLTTGGVTGTVYFDTSGRLVNAGVSTTGPVSATRFIATPTGNENNPGFSFAGETDTGMYKPTTGALAFATQAREVVRITSNGLVGINTTDPHNSFDVRGGGYFGDGTNAAIAGATLNVDGGLLIFGNNDINFYNGGVSTHYSGSGITSNLGSTAQFSITGSNGASLGINTATPTTTLDVSGSIHMADGGEACDTSRKGAIKYASSEFYVCRNGTSWESFTSIATGAAALADRITSSSQAGVTANATGYISLTTGGVTGTVYFAPNGRLVTTEISTTGAISASTLYAGNALIGSPTTASTGSGQLLIQQTANTNSNGLAVASTGGSTGRIWMDSSNGNFVFSRSATPTIAINAGDANGPRVGINTGSTATPSATLHVSGTAIISSWTAVNLSRAAVAPLEVSGTISATRFVGDGSGLTGAGVSKFLSLTDITYDAANESIGGPTSRAVTGNWAITTYGAQSLASNNNTGYDLIAIGTEALYNNTTGFSNVAIGTQALLSNTSGTENTAIGPYTLASNTTGNDNIGIGPYVLLKNTTGSSNLALGRSSMNLTTTGSDNVGLGDMTLYKNTTGFQNVAIGSSALYNNNGTQNVAIGYWSMLTATSAYYNTAVGFGTLQNTTNGTFNTAIGINAGVSNTSGGYNTMVGGWSLSKNTTGRENVAVGNFAGQNVTTGASNTLLGYGAGGTLTTGKNNIVIGYNLSPFAATGSNQLNIGDSIFGDLRGSLASRIGINVTSPTTSLEVSGTVSATRFVGDGSGLTGVTAASADRITSGTAQVIANGNSNSISITEAGVTTGYYYNGIWVAGGVSTTGVISATGLYSTGNVNIINGHTYFNANYGPTWASASSYNRIQGSATSNYMAFLTSSTEALRIVSTGYVGIGTTAPSNLLEVSASSAITAFSAKSISGSTAASIVGDLRVKGNGSGTGNGNIYLQDASSTNQWAWVANTTGTLGVWDATNSKTPFRMDANTPNYTLIMRSTGNVGIGTLNPTTTLEVNGTISATNLTVANISATANVSVTGNVSANKFIGDGSLLTGISTGTTTFASLTDVSYSAAGGNIFGPGSLTGAVNGVTSTTAFGYGALASGSNSGYSNSAFGKGALAVNTSGYHNSAFGQAALSTNTTGLQNSAFGQAALANNTTASNNSAFGRSAMQYSTTGNGNVAVGVTSLLYSAGGANVAIGLSAGQGVSGSTNFSYATLLGAYAGQGLTTGNSNTLIGYNAGGAITSGANNIVIGNNLSPFSNTGSNQLNIANSIFGDFGNAANLQAKIGINVTSPTTALEVSGTIKTNATVQTGNADTICSGTNDYGKMRFDAATKSLYLCRQ